jgi:hypothetical protein
VTLDFILGDHQKQQKFAPAPKKKPLISTLKYATNIVLAVMPSLQATH